MDIIDTGAQYKVIDLHNGRVRKIPLTRAESQAIVKSWYTPDSPSQEELATNYRQRALASCKNIKHLLTKQLELRGSFGNPIFEADDGVYTQDKMRTIHEVLQHSPLMEQKTLVDHYIDSILYFWQYGLSELVFNWTINNGITESEQIVLLDFGEITFDKEEARATIDAKRWLHSFSYTHDISSELQSYYKQQMAKRITTNALDAVWNIQQ